MLAERYVFLFQLYKLKIKIMKKQLIKLNLVFAILLVTAAGCDNGGKADRDGNKSIEGSADPVNNGGKLGGSESKKDDVRITDTTRQNNNR